MSSLTREDQRLLQGIKKTPVHDVVHRTGAVASR